MLTNPSAPAGKSQKYAKPERERRFLLAGLPAGEIVSIATITDRYFPGMRLRLRLVVEAQGEAMRTYYKLTQKTPAAEGGPGLISTMYLSREEFDLLSSLPGSVLRKTRYNIPPFGVDVFDPPLDGLIVAECEFEDDAAMHSFIPPASILAEVTFDFRFAGGTLATMDPRDLPKLLAPFGGAVNDRDPLYSPGTKLR
jgi:CYTH domain-containing protein